MLSGEATDGQPHAETTEEEDGDIRIEWYENGTAMTLLPDIEVSKPTFNCGDGLMDAYNDMKDELRLNDKQSLALKLIANTLLQRQGSAYGGRTLLLYL